MRIILGTIAGMYGIYEAPHWVTCLLIAWFLLFRWETIEEKPLAGDPQQAGPTKGSSI